jgi:hypothetical protein
MPIYTKQTKCQNYLKCKCNRSHLHPTEPIGISGFYAPLYKMIKFNLIISISILLLIIGVTGLCIWLVSYNNPVKTVIINTNYEQDTTFSEIELVHYLEILNVKYPDIVYAQARLESGNFNSPVFKLNNNLFGMKIIDNRPTTSIGSRYGFAYFKTWRDSVLDYVIYQCLYLNNKSYEEYLYYLDNVYAEDPNYINKIKNIAKKYNLIK